MYIVIPLVYSTNNDNFNFEVTMALIDILRDKHGADFHPALLLAEVITDKEQDIKLRVDCSKTLMPYIESSKKAVEVHGDLKQDFGVLRVTLFEDDETDGE